jgi:hypothetical protein
VRFFGRLYTFDDTGRDSDAMFSLYKCIVDLCCWTQKQARERKLQV